MWGKRRGIEGSSTLTIVYRCKQHSVAKARRSQHETRWRMPRVHRLERPDDWNQHDRDGSDSEAER